MQGHQRALRVQAAAEGNKAMRSRCWLMASMVFVHMTLVVSGVPQVSCWPPLPTAPLPVAPLFAAPTLPHSVAGASLCLRSLRTFLSNTVRAHSPHVAPAHDSPPPAIIIMPPDSRADLEAYSWTGERLAMKFEGGWSIGSFRRKVKRGEPDVGQSWFFYRDKGSVLLAHKLILTECGPSKTWVIIQDLPKVLGGNEAG